MICLALRLDSANANSGKDVRKPTNVIMILADDLGYGDTSVSPFVGNGVKTPNLEAMAAKGTVLTNFHTAATVCTPTRASLLTGMNPWRVGLKAVYEYGLKGKSNRDDWLPQVPTIATAFKAANYSTSHAGKWHLGGMRDDDYTLRTLPATGAGQGMESGSRRCPHPGPIQQGFDEYVSVLDGPGAPRQNSLQIKSILYSEGCSALLHDDKPLGKDGGFTGGRNPSGNTARMTLSDCEAGHAVRMMQASVKEGKPFYLQLWFHAPHGPWEYIPGYEDMYPPPTDDQLANWPRCTDKNSRYLKYCVTAILPEDPGCNVDISIPNAGIIASSSTLRSNKTLHSHKAIDDKCIVKYRITDRGPSDRMAQYRTMISAMDKAIGHVLKSLHDMGLERETMVVFTSDNGPEMDAGAIPLHELPKGNPWPDWKNWPSLYSAAAGTLRGNKRFIYEGGLKVPTIVQWVGTIPKGRSNNIFAYTTDLLPTFLHAAGVDVPTNMRLDGISILPELVHNHENQNHDGKGKTKGKGKGVNGGIETAAVVEAETSSLAGENGGGGDNVALQASGLMDKTALKTARRYTRKLLSERLVLWHNDFEGPRATAAHFQDFKLILDDSEMPFELFDLRADPMEMNNLLESFTLKEREALIVSSGARARVGGGFTTNKTGSLKIDRIESLYSDLTTNKNNIRSSKSLHILLFNKFYHTLRDYAKNGNAGHVAYLRANAGRIYLPTTMSNNRGNSKEARSIKPGQQEAEMATLVQGQCSSPCSCASPLLYQVGAGAAGSLTSDNPPIQLAAPFPVDGMGSLDYLMPHYPRGFLNATMLLML